MFARWPLLPWSGKFWHPPICLKLLKQFRLTPFFDVGFNLGLYNSILNPIHDKYEKCKAAVRIQQMLWTWTQQCCANEESDLLLLLHGVIHLTQSADAIPVFNSLIEAYRSTMSTIIYLGGAVWCRKWVDDLASGSIAHHVDPISITVRQHAIRLRAVYCL